MDDQSHLPIDRGWAWVICVACTVQTFILAGVFRSYGILFVAFMEKFDAKASDISLMLSVQQLLASFTSYLVMTIGSLLFSTRQLVIFGSFVLGMSFFISSFAKTLPLLIFSQGVLFGFGVSFVMAPGLVLIGKYFKKRLGFTNSILKLGGGVGALTFAPFIRYLIGELSLDGTLLILSAFLFNLIPCGCLLRPLTFYEKRNKNDCIENKEKEEGNQTTVFSKKQNGTSTPLNETTYSFENENGKVVKPFHYLSHDRIYQKSQSGETRAYTRSFSTSTEYERATANLNKPESPSLEKMMSSLSNNSVAIYGGIGEYSGSVGNIHLPELEDDKKTNMADRAEEEVDDRCCYNIRHVTRKQILSKLLSFSLLKNKLFLLLTLSSQLSIIGIAFANTYIPPYAVDLNIEPIKISFLVSIIGVMDLVGKLITAFISDLNSVKEYRYMILAIAMLVFGVASQFIPIITNFWSLAIYCGVYGLSGGFYIAIFAVVVIDFVGIENLPSALGIMILANGIVMAASVPFLGYMRDAIGSYLLPFHVMGACAIVGGCVLLLAPVAAKKFNWKYPKKENTEIEVKK